MTPDPPFVFLRFKGEGRRGPPPLPPALPRPGKNHHRLALPHYGITALFAVDGAGKVPGMGMENVPARRPKAGGLAQPLRGAHRRISKGCAKGYYGMTANGLGSKGNSWRRLMVSKIAKQFLPTMGVLGGEAP
jgi:hypothetical protein